MAGMVNFKVYLNESEDVDQQEVRRFGVDSDVVTNFEYFREKLQTIFPKLKGKQFTINWKDSDNDMITISSDEELILALNETSMESLRKLYVKILSGHQSNAKVSPSISPTTLHVGVICDGCAGLIRGFRFKCIQCSDFDLCSSCQSQGLHPEHCMLRLVNPLDARAHFGRRFMRHMNKFTKKNSHPCRDNDDDDNDDENDNEEIKMKDEAKNYKCGNKKWKKHNRPGCPVTSDLGSIINTVTEYINELATEPLVQPNTETENQTKQQTQDQTKKQSKKQSDSETKNNSKQFQYMNHPLLNQSSDLMKMIGQNLSYCLDQLGVDVNIQMKPSDHQEPTSSNNDKEKSNSSNNENNEVKSPVPSTSKSNSGISTPKTPDERNDTDKENKVSSSSEKTINNEPTKKVKNVYEVEKEEHSDPEWTVIKEVTPPAKEQQTNSSALYPQLPEENKIYHHNPKIQKAVELMIQMGFSNDNNQLTNLLVAKNADIVSVIDILQQKQ